MHCRFLTHLNRTRGRLLAVKRTSWHFQNTAETYSLVPKLNAVCRICLPYFQYIALMPNYVSLCRSKNHRRSWLQFCHIWLPYFYSCCLSSKMVRSMPKLNAKRCRLCIATNVVSNERSLCWALLRHSAFKVQWHQNVRHMIFVHFRTYHFVSNARLWMPNGLPSFEMFSRHIIFVHFHNFLRKTLAFLHGWIHQLRHSFLNERLQWLFFPIVIILNFPKSSALENK